MYGIETIAYAFEQLKELVEVVKTEVLTAVGETNNICPEALKVELEVARGKT